MLARQEISIAAPHSLHSVTESLIAALQRVTKPLRDGLEEIRRERAIAELPPHLQYDIGRCEYRLPAVSPLREVEDAYERLR